MKPRAAYALYVFLLVPWALLAAPAGAEARLPVLEPVAVSGYQEEAEQGLRLIFKKLEADPALALWRVEDAREVVAALEGEFKEAKPRPGLSLLSEAHTRTMAGLVPPSDTRPSALERRVREEYEALLGAPLMELPGSLENHDCSDEVLRNIRRRIRPRALAFKNAALQGWRGRGWT
ncbi:hypothetical protein KYC5002_06455 [Archangium violaceum]|uniref:hypothetical protein n=1 Tax=Archangium violaceum TaxID=83451 RepID=UPI002B2B6E95|nr:hypothetical protein KYC5002_06455 [Archangium gephyra]